MTILVTILLYLLVLLLSALFGWFFVGPLICGLRPFTKPDGQPNGVHSTYLDRWKRESTRNERTPK